jgi:hypothetical protein
VRTDDGGAKEMSFWVRLGRWLDRVFGGGGDRHPEVDPARVDTAIKLIQGAVDEQQREQQVRKLKVSELDPARQEALAQELARLLKQPPVD